MNIEWIASDDRLAELIASIDAPAVAVDTEFRRRDTFYPQIALVQLCFGDTAYLIDPLAISNPAPIKVLLTNPDILKVLHSASEDLEVFERWLGCLPIPMYDTQKAAALTGRGFGLSYRALVEAICDVALPKEETQSDWLARPLSDAQKEYAAQDVTYLFTVYETLRAASDSMGRTDWVLEEGASANTGGRGPLAKFKSAWKLPIAQQAVLRALVDWREEQAQKRDKPRSWILPDKMVTALAMTLPTRPGPVFAIDGMPPAIAKRNVKAWVELVERTLEEAKSNPPEPLEKPLACEEKSVAKKLGKVVEDFAKAENISPEILMPGRELELLVKIAAGAPEPLPLHWQGWRRTIAVDPLMTKAIEMLGRQN